MIFFKNVSDNFVKRLSKFFHKTNIVQIGGMMKTINNVL